MGDPARDIVKHELLPPASPRYKQGNNRTHLFDPPCNSCERLGLAVCSFDMARRATGSSCDACYAGHRTCSAKGQGVFVEPSRSRGNDGGGKKETVKRKRKRPRKDVVVDMHAGRDEAYRSSKPASGGATGRRETRARTSLASSAAADCGALAPSSSTPQHDQRLSDVAALHGGARTEYSPTSTLTPTPSWLSPTGPQQQQQQRNRDSRSRSPPLTRRQQEQSPASTSSSQRIDSPRPATPRLRRREESTSSPRSSVRSSPAVTTRDAEAEARAARMEQLLLDLHAQLRDVRTLVRRHTDDYRRNAKIYKLHLRALEARVRIEAANLALRLDAASESASGFQRSGRGGR